MKICIEHGCGMPAVSPVRGEGIAIHLCESHRREFLELIPVNMRELECAPSRGGPSPAEGGE